MYGDIVRRWIREEFYGPYTAAQVNYRSGGTIGAYFGHKGERIGWVKVPKTLTDTFRAGTLYRNHNRGYMSLRRTWNHPQK